ncbi:hypothetical protein BGX24_010809 [Mortierella sp. AD032]|nr:hypothetical protein BGX24_010809 [Mortierella sp. AD032]
MGDQIATVSMDQTLRLWNLSKFELGGRLQVKAQGFPMNTGEWSDPEHVDETGSKMRKDELWDNQEPILDTFNVIPFFHDDSGLSHAPIYSPDGKEVSVISAQHGILRFDTQTGASLPPLIDHNDKKMATCIAYSPLGYRMATSSEDNIARVWNTPTGSILFELNGHTAGVTSVAFSPFGHQLATSSADNTVRLWDIFGYAKEKNLRLEGHEGSVLCVVYSPDGKFIASGSEDRTMRLWNPFDGKLLAVVRDFAVGVKTIQWRMTKGRLLLLTGCKENLPQVWELVESVKGEKCEVLRYWGVGVDALAVSGARIGKDHGLGAENSTLLKFGGAVFVA